ncbi:MAG TPA: nucleotidyltransferase domain-containing protein [Nanoarchaeota archaeon]|nr:nucleotidyltransferase domain-containing protein [Nanoarchaeota archaeon]HIH66414.1 nucleotidyltransferase domain-containing protein [Nanoarchaeota archaeon]
MPLLKSLKEDKEARRIFGERELKIVEKQLLGVNLTQSEKNRLSRDIRPKLDFIRKIAGFEEEFELKKGAEIKRYIEESREMILNDSLRKNMREIILFGSAVENKLTLKSDIDLAVKFDKISLTEATSFKKRIGGQVSSKVDVQVYNHLPARIKKEIDSKGKLLYKK